MNFKGKVMKYTYNIATKFDPNAFWRIVEKMDATFPDETIQHFFEDFLDGSLLKTYRVDGRLIRVECDWDIGAVFVDSEVNLDTIICDNEMDEVKNP